MKYAIISIGEQDGRKKLYVYDKYQVFADYTSNKKGIMKFKDHSKAIQVMTELLNSYNDLFVVPVKLLPYICTEPNATDKETDCEVRFTDAAKVDKYYILLTIDTLHHGKNKYLLASRGKVYYYTRFTTFISDDSMCFETIEEAKDLINRLNEPLARMADVIATGYGTQRLEICSYTEILQCKDR